MAPKAMKVMAKRKAKAEQTKGKAKAKAKAQARASAKVAGKAKAKARKQETNHQASSSKGECTIANAFMKSAACSALAGVRLEHGGPFGAAIVRGGVIISCAHNMVLHGKDPSRHAEMNAIQQACQAIGSHDLSDCDLYTTCEPCPMCWGAVQWSRLGRVHIGVDRHTAAKYGFDDKVFYDEVSDKSGCYGLRRCGYMQDTTRSLEKSGDQFTKNMVEVYDGFLLDRVRNLFMNPLVNKTLRRRFGSRDGEALHAVHKEVFVRQDGAEEGSSAKQLAESSCKQQRSQHKTHEEFMQLAVQAAESGASSGRSKEREPFGAVIVRDGQVIAEAHNTVLDSRDATATAEVNAIRAATTRLRTHSLEGCDIYCTSHPDLMSLGAILWARISRCYCGVTQQVAAQCGFEEGIIHFKDLLEGRRCTEVVEGVAKVECEAVFKEWSDRNGVVY
jgi:guanine deaminase